MLLLCVQTYCLYNKVSPTDDFKLRKYPTGDSESLSVVSNSLWPQGVYSPWNSPSQNTGVGSLSLLQRIFPTQGLNIGLPHRRQILLPAEPQGKPNSQVKGIRKVERSYFKSSSSEKRPQGWTQTWSQANYTEVPASESQHLRRYSNGVCSSYSVCLKSGGSNVWDLTLSLPPDLHTDAFFRLSAVACFWHLPGPCVWHPFGSPLLPVPGTRIQGQSHWHSGCPVRQFQH